MRCLDLDAIIDDHREPSLASAERAEIDSHLAGCRRCSAAWLTNRALAGERIAAPRPGLLDATTRLVLAAGPGAGPARRPQSWPMVAGVSAAGLAAVIIVAALFALTSPAPRDTPSTAAVPTPERRALREGQDYSRLGVRTRALPDVGPREVEVVQLFAYDCPPCYSLERRRVERHSLAGERIVLVQVPVQWNERLATYARAFYAAQSLGKAEQIGAALYEAIHDDPAAPLGVDGLAKLFASYGVDRLTFDLAFDSTEVQASAKRARALADAYGVTAVPTFVVDGELVTTRSAAQSDDALLDIVEQLAECVERRQDGAPADLPC